MNSFYEQAWLYDLVHAKPADSENIIFTNVPLNFMVNLCLNLPAEQEIS